MAYSLSGWDKYLSPQEAQVYGQLFKVASQTKSGIVTGPEAVQFFASSGVPNAILSDIWETADRDNVGYLTPETFSIALKLIACAQHGKEVADPIISTAVPLPQFKGIQNDIAGITSPTMNNNSSSNDIITPTEREKYYAIFRAHGPSNGMLDASKSKSIFLKSKLPTETLGQIWALADTRQTGTLTQSEFAIAMHYIAKLMDGSLTTLPTQLPPSIYASASGNSSTGTPMLPHRQSPILRQMSGNSNLGTIQQQLTGNSRMIMTPPQRAATIDSLGNMAFSSSNENRPWDVTATEKAQYDTFFDKIDGQRQGFVQGKEAVEFFKNSRLPDADLAHIWDLADTSQRGRLSRNEFAVAMHLIHKRLRGDTLPPVLPITLVPPSPLPAAASPVLHRSITSVGRNFSTDPFNQPAKTTSTIEEDLLGDFGNNDQLTEETNQVNQLQNQITSLKSATVDIKHQKLTAEQTLEQLSKQKQELQAQMTQVRMAHEAEVKDLNELQEAIRQEEPEWIQARNEFEAAQQQLTATQQEIQQLRQKLESSRAESEECRRRVREIQEETAALEAQLDGLNGQVKQQSMMLDINRRQVTASEQDREQMKRNLMDAKEVQGITESARGLDINKPLSSPSPSSLSTTPRKSTTDFSIDNRDDEDSSSDDNDSVDRQHHAGESTSSFGGQFSGAATTHANSDSNKTPQISSESNSFFDIFSPHQEQAELQVKQQVEQTQAVDAATDFDAVFGDLAGIPSPDEKNDWAAFDTVTSTPTTFTSPQSDVTGTAPVASAKKHRAPPPPPPPAASKTTAVDDFALSNMDDDFDAAFSGPLSEAKVLGKQESATNATNKPSFDDFDEAFGVFDDIKDNTAKTKQSMSNNDSNSWPSQFDGFSFTDADKSSERKPPSTTSKQPHSKEADDWDSIFGGSLSNVNAPSSPASGNPSVTVPIGFEDAFATPSFDTKSVNQGASSTTETTTTSKATLENKVFTEKSIVGDADKVDELVKMGFEKQMAKDALERYDQDVAKATNFLLDQTN